MNQVSRSPRAVRTCGPVTVRVPLVPTTCARTTRGDSPRSVTFRRLNAPGAPSARSRRAAENRTVHRWYGDWLSYGSGTLTSQGFDSEPMNENSTFSVWPPDVEK